MSNFVKNIRLFQRRQKHHVPMHTLAIPKVKDTIKYIPWLSFINPLAFIIFETDASNVGYHGVLKQIPN